MSTLADLRGRFYARFDESSQNYIGLAEANALVNEGASHLHNWFVSEGEYYVWQETKVPLVTGQADYPLPPNLLKILKLFSLASSPIGRMQPIPRIMPQEYHGTSGSFSQHGHYAIPRGYMLLGQTMRIIPAPGPNAGAVMMWWSPQFTPLVADTDTTPLSMFAGAEEFIVNQAVIGARLKEESDTSQLERRQQQIMAMLQQTIINRDMGQHARVVDSGMMP